MQTPLASAPPTPTDERSALFCWFHLPCNIYVPQVPCAFLNSVACITSQSLTVFFYLPAWLKPPCWLTSKFFRFEAPVSFFRIAGLAKFQLFSDLWGAGKVSIPPSTYFSSKKSSLTQQDLANSPLDGNARHAIGTGWRQSRDVLRRCRRNRCWRDVTASACL